MIRIRSVVWASSRENLASEGCKQQRCRADCASAQSDQRLCFSLFGKYHIQTCNKRNFNFLANLCSRVGWFESHFVGNPEDRFSRVPTRIYNNGTKDKTFAKYPSHCWPLFTFFFIVSTQCVFQPAAWILTTINELIPVYYCLTVIEFKCI